MIGSLKIKILTLSASFWFCCGSLAATDLMVMKEDYGQFHYNIEVQGKARQANGN